MLELQVDVDRLARRQRHAVPVIVFRIPTHEQPVGAVRDRCRLRPGVVVLEFVRAHWIRGPDTVEVREHPVVVACRELRPHAQVVGASFARADGVADRLVVILRVAQRDRDHPRSDQLGVDVAPRVIELNVELNLVAHVEIDLEPVLVHIAHLEAGDHVVRARGRARGIDQYCICRIVVGLEAVIDTRRPVGDVDLEIVFGLNSGEQEHLNVVRAARHRLELHFFLGLCGHPDLRLLTRRGERGAIVGTDQRHVEVTRADGAVVGRPDRDGLQRQQIDLVPVGVRADVESGVGARGDRRGRARIIGLERVRAVVVALTPLQVVRHVADAARDAHFELIVARSVHGDLDRLLVQARLGRRDLRSIRVTQKQIDVPQRDWRVGGHRDHLILRDRQRVDVGVVTTHLEVRVVDRHGQRGRVTGAVRLQHVVRASRRGRHAHGEVVVRVRAHQRATHVDQERTPEVGAEAQQLRAAVDRGRVLGGDDLVTPCAPKRDIEVALRVVVVELYLDQITGLSLHREPLAALILTAEERLHRGGVERNSGNLVGVVLVVVVAVGVVGARGR